MKLGGEGVRQKTRQELIANGIFNFPAPIKQASISYAHADEDIDITLEKFDVIVKKIL